MVVDYSKSKIYKIYGMSHDMVYYGSTTQSLARRLAGHVGNFKNSKFANMTSYQIIETEDYRIELVETCPCANKEELHKIEGKYIKLNECVNKNIPGRTDKQYREDNKENIKVYKKQYRDDNKEHIKEKYDCQCGGKYTLPQKNRHFKTSKHLKFINK